MGGATWRGLSGAFVAVVLSGLDFRAVGSQEAVRMFFSTPFAALVLHTAYGPTFACQGLEGQALVGHLGDLLADHLPTPASAGSRPPTLTEVSRSPAAPRRRRPRRG